MAAFCSMVFPCILLSKLRGRDSHGDLLHVLHNTFLDSRLGTGCCVFAMKRALTAQRVEEEMPVLEGLGKGT